MKMQVSSQSVTMCSSVGIDSSSLAAGDTQPANQRACINKFIATCMNMIHCPYGSVCVLVSVCLLMTVRFCHYILNRTTHHSYNIGKRSNSMVQYQPEQAAKISTRFCHKCRRTCRVKSPCNYGSSGQSRLYGCHLTPTAWVVDHSINHWTVL